MKMKHEDFLNAALKDWKEVAQLGRGPSQVLRPQALPARQRNLFTGAIFETILYIDLYNDAT